MAIKKHIKNISDLCLICTFILMLLFAIRGEAAQNNKSAADFFANSTLTVICPYQAGGGSDYAARMFASYWTEITGGSVKVLNMTGGGGLYGTTAVWNAKPDGLTVGVTVGRSSLIGPTLLNQPGLKYDILKFNYIGSFASDETVFAIGNGVPYKSIKDLQELKLVKLGGSDKYGPTAMATALVIEWLKFKDARIIVGYGGAADLALAAARGEVDGVAQSASSFRHTIKQGYYKAPIVTIDSQRSAYWPDTPAITELKALSPDDQSLLRLVSSLRHTKVIFTTPGVPDDRIKFLQDVFDKIMVNKGFLQQIKLMYPIWTKPVRGVGVADEIKRVMEIPKKDLDKMTQLINKYAR